MARNILGWSDAEFWDSFPRKFFAVYYAYVALRESINGAVPVKKELLGKEAINSLTRIANSIR